MNSVQYNFEHLSTSWCICWRYPCMACNNLHRWHIGKSTNVMLHLMSIFNMYPCMACIFLNQWYLQGVPKNCAHHTACWQYPCVTYNNLYWWHLGTSTNIMLHLMTNSISIHVLPATTCIDDILEHLPTSYCICWRYPCEACNNLHRWHLGTSTNIILHLLAISMCSLQQPALVTSRYIYQHHTASAGNIHVWPTTTCIDI